MTPLRFSRYLHLLVLIASALLVGACAGTQLTSSWTNPKYDGAPMTKTAVIVLAKDDGVRRFAEDQMIQQLPKGTVAVAGYTLFDKPEQAKVDEVRAKLTQEGFDSVLVSRLASVGTTERHMDAQTYNNIGVDPKYGSFSRNYAETYASVYSTTIPEYTIENTRVEVETMLYRVSDGMMVWTATTESLNPQSKPELAQNITDLIGNQLKKTKLLGPISK